MKKICKRCGSEKDINEFRLMKGDKKNYYLGICKKCESDKQREYFKDEEKRKRHLEYVKRYRDKHKEELKKKNHEYNMAHREERARKQREYYKLNRDTIMKKNKARYQENKDMINRARRQKNLERKLNGEQIKKRRKVQKEVFDRVTEMVEEEIRAEDIRKYFENKRR